MEETNPVMDTTKQIEIKETPRQHISPKTLVLIVVLLLITGGLLYLAIRQEQPAPAIHMSTAPTPSPAHATLSLVQEPTATAHTIQVMIQSHQNKITGVQLNLAYDPRVLTNVTIGPGTFFTSPTTLFSNVDKVNGRISYVLGIQPNEKEVSGAGVVAVISYTLLPNASASATKLSFLPKTEVTQQGVLGSVLKTMTDLTITIPQSPLLSPVPTLTR